MFSEQSVERLLARSRSRRTGGSAAGKITREYNAVHSRSTGTERTQSARMGGREHIAELWTKRTKRNSKQTMTF
jgi:hypothetical protein